MRDVQSSKFTAKVLAGVLGFSCLMSSVAMADATIGAPEWSGDFRLRGEYNTVNGGGANPVGQGQLLRDRIAAHLIGKWTISDNTSFRLGFSTGSATDPRSDNASLGGLNKQAISLNLVELTHNTRCPISGAAVVLKAGKMDNLLYTESELVWDKDIKPEGVAFVYGTAPAQGLGLVVNGGVVELSEWKSSAESPTLFVLQPVVTYANGDYSAKAGLSYNYFTGDGVITNYTAFQPVVVDARSTQKNFFGFASATAYGTYVVNPKANDGFRDQGYLIGAKLGAAKVQAAGDWQVDASYRAIGNLATPGTLVDSDFYFGQTVSGATVGVQGVKVAYSYGVAANTALGVNAIFAQQVDPVTGAGQSETLVQTDLKFNF